MSKLQDSKHIRSKSELKFNKKKILIALLLIIFLVISPFKYDDFRKDSIKKETEVYLKQRGYTKKDIIELKPFRSAKGPEKYMVELKLKGDKGGYNLYKDSKDNKIKVDVYVIDGVTHLVKEVKQKP